jgi:hypothetical protein
VSIERIPPAWKFLKSRQVKSGGEEDFPKLGTLRGDI